MFSGIVEGNYVVEKVEHKPGLISLRVGLPESLTSQVSIGASVSIEGVCLTATKVDPSSITFDIILETVRVTTLRDLAEGDLVNVELSLSANKDISGHIVSGHVDDTVLIESIDRPDENNCTVIFRAKPEWMKYIFPKGFICLNGCSLTVGFVDRQNNRFCVYLIPETIRRTSFGYKKVGDEVNLEVERQTQVIVDTITVFLERLETKLLSGEGSAATLEKLVPQLVGSWG